MRSFQELSRVDTGFDPTNVLTFRITGSFAEPFQSRVQSVERMLEELAALPGVEGTAASSPVPGVLDDGSGFQFGVTEWELADGGDADVPPLSEVRVVSPSYFATMAHSHARRRDVPPASRRRPSGDRRQSGVCVPILVRPLAARVARCERPTAETRHESSASRGTRAISGSTASPSRPLQLRHDHRVSAVSAARAHDERPDDDGQYRSSASRGHRAAALDLRRHAARATHRQRVFCRPAAHGRDCALCRCGAAARVARHVRDAELRRELEKARNRPARRVRGCAIRRSRRTFY